MKNKMDFLRRLTECLSRALSFSGIVTEKSVVPTGYVRAMFVVCLFGVGIVATQGASTEENRLSDGGFEDDGARWILPKEATVAKESAHGGAACLRFATAASDWGPCASQVVSVPKNTFMTISGWIKAERLGAAELRLILFDADGKYLGCEIDGGLTKGTHDWVYFENIFDTGEAERVNLWLRVKGDGSVAWFDDLSLNIGCPKAGNYLRNSGFSICPTPGYPAWWGVSVFASINNKDWETGRYYEVDDGEPSPVAGTKALRIRSGQAMNVASFMRKPLPRGLYTASAYLKAEGDVSVTMSIPLGAGKEIKPGREWERFQFAFMEACEPGMLFNVKGTGIVWVAAPQLEAGGTATPWLPAVFDTAKLAALDTKIVPPPPRSAFPLQTTRVPPDSDGEMDKPCREKSLTPGAPRIKAADGNPQADAFLPLRGMVEFSWYPTNAESARILVEWMLDESSEIRLDIENSMSQSLFLKGREKKHVELPLDGLSNGRHPLRLTAIVNGHEAATTRDVIVKRPQPEGWVRLNRFLRCIEVNGKPYFPIIFHPQDCGPLEDWQLERLAKQGFNTLVPITPPRMHERSIEAMHSMLDRCAARNFKVIYWVDGDIYGTMEDPKPMEQCREGLRRIINEFRGHPAGLAWYIMDEPLKENWETKCKRKESDLKLLYDTAAETDPDIPITINYCFCLPMTPLYGGFDAQDFNMYDTYPWYPDERSEPLEYFAGTAKKFNDLLEPLGRFTPFWLQTWGTRDAFREPTPDEWQNTVYSSLIHGSRGLAYFMCQPYSVPLWKRMGEVHAQIRALEPVFFHRNVKALRDVCDSGVHYAVWITPDAIHVMAANVVERSAEFALDLNRLASRKVGGGEILFGKEARRFEGGRLAETLAPGQTRVYRFEWEGE